MSRAGQRNVSVSVPYGVVRVGIDEAENGTDDTWLTNPGPEVQRFERGWRMSPRELSDWIHAEGDGFGVTFSSSVGVWDWRDATGLYDDHTRSARQANHPLRAVPQPPPPAAGPAVAAPTLPASGSFLSVSGANLHVGAVKKEDGANPNGVIVRVADAESVASTATLALRGGARAAETTSIIELAPRAPLAVNGGNVTLPVGRWSIETVRLGVFRRSRDVGPVARQISA